MCLHFHLILLGVPFLKIFLWLKTSLNAIFTASCYRILHFYIFVSIPLPSSSSSGGRYGRYWLEDWATSRGQTKDCKQDVKSYISLLTFMFFFCILPLYVLTQHFLACHFCWFSCLNPLLCFLFFVFFF